MYKQRLTGKFLGISHQFKIFLGNMKSEYKKKIFVILKKKKNYS